MVVTPAVLLLVLSVIGLHPVVFSGRVSVWPRLAPNIRTTDELRSAIEDLLARSPTLRDQSARIAIAKHTYVSVTLSLVRIPSQTRARSTARKYQTGLLVVDVELPPASQDFAALLAHELEHVVEFIDGIDFKKLAGDRHAGVQCGVDGSFETERAQKAERAVKLELEAYAAIPTGPAPTASGSAFGWRRSRQRQTP